MTELSIVVPVFKEGEAVEPVLRALDAGVATPHEILVVYDFDEDPTVPVIERLHAELPAIRGLRNDLGRGVLNAMKAGIAASAGDYVLISMSDGSDEPQVVDPMVELARGGADVVSASRYMTGGHQVGGPLLKRLMSRTAGLTLHWFGGVATHDPTNNFKLYSRRFLDATTIESEAGFELALELTVKATLDRRRIAEVPTTWRDRTAGPEQLQAPQVAAALPALVLDRDARPALAAAQPVIGPRPRSAPRARAPPRRASRPPVPDQRRAPVRRAVPDPVDPGERHLHRLLHEHHPDRQLPRHRNAGSSSAGATRARGSRPFPLLFFLVIKLVAVAQLNVTLGSPDDIVIGGRGSSGGIDANVVVLAAVFGLVTAVMAALALPVGGLLRSMPPLRAYAFDILGSMAGIAAFTLLSWVGVGPVGWLVVIALLALLLGLSRGLTAWSFVSAAALVGCLFVARRVHRPVVAIPATHRVGEGWRRRSSTPTGSRTRGSR